MYKRAREEGLADLIFTNERGEVTEGCISNIFVKKNGTLITPPVKCGLLNGLMRQYILNRTKNVSEEILFPDDVINAEKIYICNSVRGIREVKLFNKYIDKHR